MGETRDSIVSPYFDMQALSYAGKNGKSNLPR